MKRLNEVLLNCEDQDTIATLIACAYISKEIDYDEMLTICTREGIVPVDEYWLKN